MAYIAMTYIAMTYIALVCIAMAYIAMAYIAVAYIVVADNDVGAVSDARIVTAFTVMAIQRCRRTY